MIKPAVLGTKYMAYTLCAILFSILAISCLTTFFDGPAATDIELSKPDLMPKVTISVCKNKQLYKSIRLSSSDSFLDNEKSFWEDNLDIRDMISEVSIVQRGEYISVWNQSLNSDEYFKKNFLPGDDGNSVDFCFTSTCQVIKLIRSLY